MIFIPYDLEQYQSYRGFLFDFDTHTPGDKVGTQAEFMESIDRALNKPELGAIERAQMKNLFHTYEEPEMCSIYTYHTRECDIGKACGDTCISDYKTCHVGRGSACNKNFKSYP